MKKITDRKIINYLAMKGLIPTRETREAAFYSNSPRLSRLLEDCYIEHVAFYNWQPRRK